MLSHTALIMRCAHKFTSPLNPFSKVSFSTSATKTVCSVAPGEFLFHEYIQWLSEFSYYCVPRHRTLQEYSRKKYLTVFILDITF